MVTVNDLAERMKREILAHVAQGVVLSSVRSFDQLHAFVDANAYGGLCEDTTFDDLVATHAAKGEDGLPQSMMDLVNAAQGIVNEWLMKGGPAGQVDPGPSMTEGPWGSCAGLSSNPDAIRLITGPEAELIATVHQRTSMSQAEALANAKAIRAVPDLIDAMVMAERELSWHPDFAQGNSKVHFVVHKLRAALSAAR